MAKSYTEKQVADMVMNDDIGEMESADSMSHLLNPKLLVLMMSYPLNPKLIVALILILNFMLDESLSKNVLFKACQNERTDLKPW